MGTQTPVLKTVSEVEREDLILIEDKRYIIISVNILKDTKQVHLELRSENNYFNIIDYFQDLDDLFIVLED